jgi:hypothetical protein
LEGPFDFEKYFKNQNKRFFSAKNIREPKQGYETLKNMKKLKHEVLCFFFNLKSPKQKGLDKIKELRDTS